MENNDITLKDKLNRMFFKENNETYSLKIITDWLKQKNMKDMNYEEAFKRLEEILNLMNSGQVALDKYIELTRKKSDK